MNCNGSNFPTETYEKVMQNFIRVYAVCYDKNDVQRNTIFFGNYNLWPLDIYTVDHPKFIVSNQKEESIQHAIIQ